jgi:hypothetical protein
MSLFTPPSAIQLNGIRSVVVRACFWNYELFKGSLEEIYFSSGSSVIPAPFIVIRHSPLIATDQLDTYLL